MSNFNKNPQTSTKGKRKTPPKPSTKSARIENGLLESLKKEMHTPFPAPTKQQLAKGAIHPKFTITTTAKHQQPYAEQITGQRGKTTKALKTLLGHIGASPFDLVSDLIPKKKIDKYLKIANENKA
jgi:hypothetical protein